MKLIEGLMIETGTYTPPALRSFNSHITPEAVYQVQEATEGGRRMNPATLAGIAGNIIQPSAQPNGGVAIVNGWDERRIRFMMRFFYETGFNSGLVEIVSGYTDHMGVIAMSGAVDPNMRMFFNNSILARTTNETTPYGRVNRLLLTDASQVLANPVPNMPGYSMRPEDVVGSMSVQHATGFDNNLVDTRSQFIGQGSVKKSRRDNANAPHYLSRVMKGLTSAFESADYNSDAATIYDNAKDNVSDYLVSKDPLLFKFIKETNYSYTGYITYNEFLRMFPNADAVIGMFFQGQMRSYNQNMPDIVAGNSERWNVTTVEARVATTMSYSVPALMMDLMLTDLAFMATNETLHGQPIIQIRNANSFAKDIDLSPYLDTFIQRMQIEVLADIFANNMMTYTLEVAVDVIGDTVVRVGINGQPPIDFITPSFCDSLMSPVLTNNHMNVQNIASDLDALYNHLGSQPDVRQRAPAGYAHPPMASHGAAPDNGSIILPAHMRR